MPRYYKLDDYLELRTQICKHHKIEPLKRYSETEFLWLIGKVNRRTWLDWLKDAEAEGRPMPGRVVGGQRKYLGIDAADWLILGKEYGIWQRTEEGLIRSASGSSDNEEAKEPGSAADMTKEPDKPDASALARKIIAKRAKG